MKVTLLAALAENRVIGRDNDVPWHLPEDLKGFMQRTLGRTIIMGRRTLESLDKPLPGRSTIVLTRRADYHPDGVRVARSLDEALAMVAGEDEVFIVGGEAVYAEALPRADAMHLTIVHAEVEGDTRFPPFDPDEWTVTEEQRHEADERHEHAFTFRTYVRRR